MKINRKVKMLLGTFFGIVLFLFIVLVVHIATVEPVEIDNATLQISRIDFETPLDSVETKEVHRNLKSINGVKNIKIFSEKGIVVYFHDNRVVNAERVFNQLSSLGNYKAQPFTVSQEIASKKVCPAMNTNSFGYKFSRGIQRIFN
jgi:copper chaperone CopZ